MAAGWFGDDGPFATDHLVTANEWNSQRLPYYIDETTTVVASTAAETNLYLVQIPAGGISADGSCRTTLFGQYFNNDGAGRTLIVTVYLGATVMYRDTSVSITNTATTRAWYLTLDLANANATNSQVLGGMFTVSAAGATTGLGDIGTAAPVLMQPIYGTAAVDTTSNQNFAVAVQHSAASANLSIARNYGRTEMFPATV